MNAERLHAILLTLKRELTEKRVAPNMQSVLGALQGIVNQSNAPSQQALDTNLRALFSALNDNASDKFSPTWREILREIGGEDLFGNPLRKHLEATLAKNQLTPAVALTELQETFKHLQAFDGAVNSALSAFRVFGIGDEKLQPGDCEIAVLIPRQEINNKLLDFSAELKELGFILNTFSEIATGGPSDLEIKTVSSTNLLVVLDAAVPYAACLALAIERIVSLYKQLLEIRRLRQEIRSQGVPEKEMTGIEKYANGLMQSGIEKAAKEIVEEFYKQKDNGRKNELIVALGLSMNRIANRIDRGFNIEVRIEPPDHKDEKGENEDLQKAVAQIESATPSMQFLKLEGQPLLKLRETVDKHAKKVKGTEENKEEKDE